MTLPAQRYLRRGAVQRYLGVSEQMMKKLVEAGVLTPVYFGGGGRAFFDRDKILEAESSGRLFTPRPSSPSPSLPLSPSPRLLHHTT